MKRFGLSALAVSMLAGLAAGSDVSPNAGMLRFPDVSATHIVFSYANDLWIVPKAGGTATPLSSPPGGESLPKFSPDGKTIAFVGNYDGNRDIYTLGLDGGVPTRVTHHPGGENLSEWTPDGKGLVFISNGFAGLARQSQLFTVPSGGGAYEKLPVPYGGFGAISPDGAWLAYTPHSTETRTWKRYRGGMATDVWLFNLKDKTSKQITDWEGTDTMPMWVPGGDGKVVYYHSDAGPEHRLNIWSYEIATGKREQVTAFKEDDIKWPSIGPGSGGKGEIVFQLGSKLMLLDLATKQSKEVKVTIPGDRPKIKTRTVDASKYINGASVSPSAKRVVIEARGEIWSAPVKEGVIRNLTRTDGNAERDPSWSPDGKWIAYFSEETGDYELWVRPSDARPAEEKKDESKKDDAKKDDKKAEGEAKGEEKKDEAKKDEVKKAEPKPEPRKLTSLGAGYRYNPNWSPDSKMIAFTDNSGNLQLTEVETGKTRIIDTDPNGNQLNVSWSQDSKWMAYSRGDEGNRNGVVWIAEAKTGEKKPITSPMFASTAPAFDRKGDWIFFSSQRAINNPEYSDVDNTYAYRNSEVLLMCPLRKDVKSPWLPQSDEETLKKDEKKEDKKKDDAKKDDAKKDDAKKDAPTQAAADDGVSGTWQGQAKGNGADVPPGGIPFSLTIKLGEGNSCSGTITSPMGGGSFTGTYDKASGKLELSITIGQDPVTFTGTLKNGEATGTWTHGGGQSGEWTAKRSSSKAGDDKGGDEGKKDGEKAKEVKIDFDGIEARAIQIPVTPGNFGQLAVADGEKLIFSRGGSRGGGGDNGIRIYDYKADDKEEKAVTAGGGWQMTPDGKKLMVQRGGSITIVDASAGGGKAQSVPTAGMSMTVDPRKEWKQILNEAWRLQRDFFYEPSMHGVDWQGVHDHYMSMVDDCSSREDVNFLISEMISELNIGHAYLQGPGDVEGSPSVGVGLLGCDFTLDKSGAGGGAYKITRIQKGAAWDTDARGPLSQPGIDVKEGDYLLAVDGVPLDTSKDPYAAFIGTTGRVTSLTVSSNPTLDGHEREVLVKPVATEVDLRYRAWIETKRAYVAEKSGGQLGYIYVPNTGVDGQNDLYRQFVGQREKQGLIIDDRWNGGGQIPSRFIEMLSRPATNYWAIRHGQDWTWPPDGSNGRMCMLINGLAGSGGDMFPWLFKYHKMGKVIGMRTWGGLVGISGNPGLIDGGSITVPTFGFYKTDGTWGVEGHGVDPDIRVVDDPALMQSGGDPQLDTAIQTLMDEVKAHPYTPPKRPDSPTYRKGMGIQERDK